MARKRKKKLQHGSQFRPGNRQWNKGLAILQAETISSYCRPTEDQESLYVNKDRQGNILQNDIETLNAVGSRMVLRPAKLPGHSEITRLVGEKEDRDDVEGYRIWHAKIAVHACVSAQRERDKRRPDCNGLVRLSSRRERKKGLATSETLVCDTCQYESPSRKFYGEVARQGAKMAVPNLAMQVAMFNSPIGPTVLREIAATLQLAVPSDTSYQTPLRNARGKEPGQPIPKSVTNVVENVTPWKAVIGSLVRNKICPTCNMSKASGTSPPPHKCSANIPEEAVIGDEKQAAKEIARKFLTGPNKTPVGDTAEDWDSSFSTGMKEVMEEAEHEVKAFKDIVHLSKSIKRKVTTGSWSKQMFPGQNQDEKDRVRNRFGDDRSKRLNAEHKAGLKKFRKKRTMENKMKRVMEVIPYCYEGDHTRCYERSLVCKHPKRWKFMDLPEQARGKIRPNSADLTELRRIMEHRLGVVRPPG
ncbi:PREDICTED: uncharacterized protein LOC109480633 [Branchiostoma belcheri]|uniref:Uncharacterized protein LOC109480633 n=1 Tax=Branchiostoma belcheri TaxID=7741 RepID=A0A6P5A9I8_BRABE|nr:PREDICTED: uncharacterized protein LOC109480633 [Branchiostoma belcheri]